MLFKQRKLSIIIVCLLALILSSCSQNPTTPAPTPTPTTAEKGQPISKSDYILGTVVQITLYDSQDESLIDKSFDRLREIEKKMTINNAETSEIIALNNAAGVNPVKVSPDTFDVLERGKYYSEATKGEFDITVGSIVKLWNIGTDYAAVPDPKILEQKRELINYKKLILDRNNLTAYLEDKGMQVDLGAIAKGYSADEVAKILVANGVHHAIINLGGNVLTVGGNMQDKPWKIGIQDPFNPRGDYIGIITVTDETVVTSGTYERYFIAKDGKRYHHILDPQTGYPANNDIASVSVITKKSIDGDGNSTSLLLLGLDKGMKFVEQEGFGAIFITYDKKVYVTPDLKDRFTITNPDFKLMN